MTDFIGRSAPIRDVAGDLFNTTYGNGWYYFAEQSAHTPETYGTCFFLRINNWSFRLAIGTTKAIYTNVNIGQGFGEWVKHCPMGIRSGAGTAYIAANSYADIDVAFSAPYTIAPVVVATGGHSGKYDNSGVMLLSTTTTGFKLRVYNVSSGAADLFYRWIAMPANP